MIVEKYICDACGKEVKGRHGLDNICVGGLEIDLCCDCWHDMRMILVSMNELRDYRAFIQLRRRKRAGDAE